ncbi:hypothetical protein VP01_3015g2 [Puccinia sorghi]|uniref:Uncharacterized protein n=1 Tax=Puccinia sorghi TaxID=27349 RepID=A0A0L6V203_9BASI|nr:hypothetical protein VP01_3015g2 [Puccinia sorghi]
MDTMKKGIPWPRSFFGQEEIGYVPTSINCLSSLIKTSDKSNPGVSNKIDEKNIKKQPKKTREKSKQRRKIERNKHKKQKLSTTQLSEEKTKEEESVRKKHEKRFRELRLTTGSSTGSRLGRIWINLVSRKIWRAFPSAACAGLDSDTYNQIKCGKFMNFTEFHLLSMNYSFSLLTETSNIYFFSDEGNSFSMMVQLTLYSQISPPCQLFLIPYWKKNSPDTQNSEKWVKEKGTQFNLKIYLTVFESLSSAGKFECKSNQKDFISWIPSGIKLQQEFLEYIQGKFCYDHHVKLLWDLPGQSTTLIITNPLYLYKNICCHKMCKK